MDFWAPTPKVSDSVHLEEGLRICMFPILADVVAAGLQTTLLGSLVCILTVTRLSGFDLYLGLTSST